MDVKVKPFQRNSGINVGHAFGVKSFVGDTPRFTEALRARLEAEPGAPNETDAVKISSSGARPQLLEPALSSIKSAVGVAKDAAESISSLRQEQYALAEKASELAQGEELDSLNSRFSSLQQRIDEISEEAVYRGQNVLGGGTYASGVRGAVTVTGVPNFSAITSDPGVNLATPAAASAAETTLGSLVVSSRQFGQSSAGAHEAAAVDRSAEVDEVNPLGGADAQRLTYEKAAKIAGRVAADLSERTGAFSQEAAKERIIEAISAHDLDPEKVKELTAA